MILSLYLVWYELLIFARALTSLLTSWFQNAQTTFFSPHEQWMTYPYLGFFFPVCACYVLKYVSFECNSSECEWLGAILAPQSSTGLEPRWQMVACLQGLDSDRASNTANTDDWVEEDAARTWMLIFIVSVFFFILSYLWFCPPSFSVSQSVFPTRSMYSSFFVFCNIFCNIFFNIIIIKHLSSNNS